jgi:hypothetical protein
MTHFSLNPAMVRGELFTIREGGGGKWKYTVQFDMSMHWDDVDIQEAVIKSFRESDDTGVVKEITGYQLVVQDPYHRNAHPVCVVI